MAERRWTGLAEDQADGRACVACGRDFRTPGSSAVPVGRSRTGSQVFACDGRCAAATAGEAAPPLWVPVGAVDALCDASSGVFRRDLEVAVRETVAPLIVTAELRRLAEEVEGDARGHERLRERADELDAEIAGYALSGRWVMARAALAAGATVEQTAAAMGLEPGELRTGLTEWAAGQRRFGLITDAEHAAVLALVTT